MLSLAFVVQTTGLGVVQGSAIKESRPISNINCVPVVRVSLEESSILSSFASRGGVVMWWWWIFCVVGLWTRY